MYPLKDLPNIDGFEFIGILFYGSGQVSGSLRVPCRVVKCSDGLHRIEGAAWGDLRGWIEKPKTLTDVVAIARGGPAPIPFKGYA